MKISLLFLTSETPDFESEQDFEIHEHLQSTADMMPVLTCFYMAQIWPNLVHIKAFKDWHHVSSALEVLMTFKDLLRLKI